MLLFHSRGHGQIRSGPIETSHGTWLWLRWTRHWQMGTSAKAGNWLQLCISTGNLRMRLCRTPLGWTLCILVVWRGQHARQILFLAGFRRSKSIKGATAKKAKKIKKVKQEYQKQQCANFKTCNQWNISFWKCTLGLFLCNGCFFEHKVEDDINV